MKLSISNIAWQPNEERAIAKRLQEQRVRYVEVAPARIGNPATVTDEEIDRYRAFWRDHDISIVAMQALLFGRPDLVVFGDATTRAMTIDYIHHVIRMASRLDVPTLVFGSPRNRSTGNLGAEEILAIEKDFFATIGELAHQNGVSFCVEPNPVEYDCDYLNTVREVDAMTRRVALPGLGLHLDAAAMALAGEPPSIVDSLEIERIRHVHISEPSLAPIGSSGLVPHAELADALRRNRYARWVSIEMRAPGDAASIDAAIRYARAAYTPTE